MAFAQILIMCEWNQDTVYAYDMSVWLAIQVTVYMYRVLRVCPRAECPNATIIINKITQLTVYSKYSYFTVKYCRLNQLRFLKVTMSVVIVKTKT